MNKLDSVMTVKIDAFEGPFDLLFHLIEKNKLDIYDIPISLITDQYLDFINKMNVMDLDATSEFLVMASTLLHIKSRMLLPVDDGGEEDAQDPRNELVVSMLEYKRYKDFTASLREKAAYWADACYRPAGLDYAPANAADENERLYLNISQPTLYDMDGNRLLSVYRNLLKLDRMRHEQVEGKVNKIIGREHITLALKIKEIAGYLAHKRRFLFQKIFNPANTPRLGVIVAFTAVLELSQQNLLSLRQKRLFGGLLVSRRESKAS